MTFIYEPDSDHVKLSLQSKNKPATFRLSKVIAIHNKKYVLWKILRCIPYT